MKERSALSYLPRLFVIGLSLVISSCTAGPDFFPPPTPTLTEYTKDKLPAKTVSLKGQEAEVQYFVCGKDIPAEWWHVFHSKPLNELIKRALRNNPTLASVQATWRQAEQSLRASMGGLFPSVTFQPNYQRQGQTFAIVGLSSIPYTSFNLFNTPININYTFDAWGATRRKIEAEGARLNTQKFVTEATYLTLVTNIVTAAITEAALRGQIKALEEITEIQEKILHLTEEKFKIGAISSLDVLAQKEQLFNVKASLCPLQNALSQTRHSLAVLIGETPHEAALPVFELDTFTLPRDLPVSLPSALVKQRPDIRIAEETLHAACAQVGVATANMLPQVNLAGSYGWTANALSAYFAPANALWNLTTGLLQPVFQGGTLLARKREAVAALEQAYAEYRRTVLVAFQNVADTLRAIQIDAETLAFRVQTEQASFQALRLVRDQYKIGAVSYLNVLDAERNYLYTRISQIQARASRYASTAALFQALGGGWWNTPKQKK